MNTAGRSEIEAQYEARLAVLVRERDELKARAERAEHERNEFRKLYHLVLLELERMKRQLFGQKAETVDPRQVQLAFAPVLDALERARTGDEGAAGEVESELAKLRERAQAEVARRQAEKRPPKPHGRRDLSLKDLPVETITLEPPERLLPGGESLEKIGEEVSEHIDRRPASLVRVRVVRPKYKTPEPTEPPLAVAEGAAEQAKAGSIVIAALPERPIPRGIAGPGLLAHVLVSKFADHLPLHRQEKIFRREGLHLPRHWWDTATIWRASPTPWPLCRPPRWTGGCATRIPSRTSAAAPLSTASLCTPVSVSTKTTPRGSSVSAATCCARHWRCTGSPVERTAGSSTV